ncbi:MAG: hypothetical protein JWL81_1864, partial [Verrucomicrobiales bacterium]|nr:hypothetical protein [Verrucomicrobiales bacterium]
MTATRSGLLGLDFGKSSYVGWPLVSDCCCRTEDCADHSFVDHSFLDRFLTAFLMLDSLLTPLNYDFMQRAIWVSALVGGVCGFLS